MREQQTPPNYIELAADLVSAFVSNNPVPAAELPTLISTVHAALTKTANGSSQQPTEEPKKAPAVSVKKSVQPDYLVCLGRVCKLPLRCDGPALVQLSELI